MNDSTAPQVALFVTCLADLFRPSVAFSSIALLEAAGCEVTVPETQTCCGQPGYNSGAIDESRPLAKQLIDAFAGFNYVVMPSGSCAGMVKHHYPSLLADEDDWHAKALDLAGRCWEITTFLDEVLQFQPAASVLDGQDITYHDSCAGLREMGIKSAASQPARQVWRASQRDAVHRSLLWFWRYVLRENARAVREDDSGQTAQRY